MTQQPTTGALCGTSPTVHQTTHHQIPAVSPPLSGSGGSPQAGRPAAEHGEAGEPAPRPRPRRAPCNDLPVTSARPVTLVRYRPGVVGETARTVHLVPLPVGDPAGAVTALCGTPLRREDVDSVTAGQGMPCPVCVLSHLADDPPPPPVTTGDTRVDPDPLVATAGYRARGWPVILRRDQIRLNLDGDTGALIIPAPLAIEVTAILATRRCPVPVLAHPYAPEHRILLVAERFGVTLPWPPGVHQVTGTLLLPPTVTPRGPITWIQQPGPDAVPLCREIDVLAALRTALNDPPAPH